jgi:hypothetical protein
LLACTGTTLDYWLLSEAAARDPVLASVANAAAAAAGKPLPEAVADLTRFLVTAGLLPADAPPQQQRPLLCAILADHSSAADRLLPDSAGAAVRVAAALAASPALASGAGAVAEVAVFTASYSLLNQTSGRGSGQSSRQEWLRQRGLAAFEGAKAQLLAGLPSGGAAGTLNSVLGLLGLKKGGISSRGPAAGRPGEGAGHDAGSGAAAAAATAQVADFLVDVLLLRSLQRPDLVPSLAPLASAANCSMQQQVLLAADGGNDTPHSQEQQQLVEAAAEGSGLVPPPLALLTWLRRRAGAVQHRARLLWTPLQQAASGSADADVASGATAAAGASQLAELAGRAVSGDLLLASLDGLMHYGG